HAEVELALRDEGRRLPLRGVAERALVLPLPLRLPHGTAHAQLAIDAAVVDAVLRLVVRRARMDHEALELIRLAVEPVHQVSAVARADRALPRGVDERIPADRLGGPFEHFL